MNGPRHWGKSEHNLEIEKEEKQEKTTRIYENEFRDYPGKGCRACGNPAYPNCKSSCPLFDD